MGRPIRILFGTETGNAEGCAEELQEAVEGLGLTAELFDMDDYDHDDLQDEGLLFIVTSTFGNGDPPYNAHEFMEFVKGPDAPSLESLKFSVCGFGDRSYPNFAQCGKDFDARLGDLGGTRVVPRMDCDVDFEVPFDEWKQQVVAWLRDNVDGASAAAPAPQKAGGKKKGLWGKVSGWFGGKGESQAPPPSESAAPSPMDLIKKADAATAPTVYTRDKPFEARVVGRRLLSSEGSAKETMHYVLDLSGSGIAFQGGDSFGVHPTNPPAEVAGIVEGLGLDPEAPVELKGGRTLALRGALARRKDLQRVPMDLLRALSADGGPGADALEAGGDAVKAYLEDKYVLDVVREHPDASLEAQRLVDLLRALPPRLYSVANSPLVAPDQVHFLVETLRYERCGRGCEGVASVWLADRLGDDPVPLYLHKNDDFRLADDDVDIIMIGPGTGLAPFRAFLQEREHTGAEGRSWLFFGHQHEATDWLYRDELEEFEDKGVLDRASYAWSRDQAEKVYVQHKMREEAAELWDWLQGGAHVYVCGDAKHMAGDVHQALLQIAREQGHLDEHGAEAWIQGLIDAKRYHRDVY